MNIFDVDPALLAGFRSDTGTRFMAALLRCEAYRARIPLQQVVISIQTTIKDGGIDAKVVGKGLDCSLLAKGTTYFQIKTGSSFKPWLEKHLRKEFFGGADPRPLKGTLGKEIRRCLGAKRKYVIVTLGHDLTPQQHSDAVSHATKLLRQCGYSSPKIEVMGQGQIVALLSLYPSLCLELNGMGETPFLSYATLAARADLKNKLHIGDSQQRFVEELRAAWRSTEFQHVRIVGEPGIGKTRLVVEAASAEDLRATLVYIPHAEDFQKSLLFNELLKPDRPYSLSLVVDECEEHERASIWGALKGKSQVKLITLDHGPETPADSPMKSLGCPPLGDEPIKAILADYIGQSPHLSNWVEWCQGSPRVAHAVGANLKLNAKDILKSPDTVPIWERFVVGARGISSTPAQESLLVFRYIALFERFGFNDPVAGEGQFIASLAQQANPQITWPRFQAIVRSFYQRRILQGRHTLFVVPKALHIYFWVEFWNEHGRAFDFDSFYSALPAGLKNWFIRLFRFAHASPIALGVVTRVLDLANGPFRRLAFVKSKTGCVLLAYLAEAAPEQTLNVIERTFGIWSHDELLGWTNGRSEIVWALTKLAVWDELFHRVALVLKRLALAENSTYSNNSKGTLVGLFIIGQGWAATTAPPATRLPVLRQMLESADDREFRLALEMAKEWLETYGGSRAVGPEYQGLRAPIQFWRPKIWNELFDAWRDVWRLLLTSARQADSQRRRATYAVLVDRAISLLQWQAVQTEILDTLSAIADDPEGEKSILMTAVSNALLRPKKAYSSRVLKRLKSLDRTLSGQSFWARVERFVLGASWFDYTPDSSSGSPQLQRDKREFKKLVSVVVRNPEIIEQHIDRLLTSAGRQLTRFGAEIAKARGDDRLDGPIFAAVLAPLPQSETLFVSGYLSGVREIDFPRYEELALRVIDSNLPALVVANCIRWAGLSDLLVTRLLSRLRGGTMVEQVFDTIGFARSQGQITQALFDQTVDTLLERGSEPALAIAIQGIDAVYCQRANNLVLPIESTWKAIFLASRSQDHSQDGMRDFYLYRVAEKFIHQHPSRHLDLLDTILTNLTSLSPLRSPHDLGKLADEIIKLDPGGAWQVIVKTLEQQGDEARQLVDWLGDSNQAHAKQPGAMRWLNANDVMKWIERNPSVNSKIIYKSLPKTLVPGSGGEIADRFIERFGEDRDISNALQIHFLYGESWMGPRSGMIRNKRDEARTWLELPLGQTTRNWVSRYITMLNDEIARCEIDEERDFLS
jgi:hypothetical protein